MTTHLSCAPEVHAHAKAHWRELTDEWRPWPAIRPDAISVRCRACGSHLIVYAPEGCGASSPENCGSSTSGAPFEAGGGRGPNSEAGHGVPAAPPPAVFAEEI